jgi:hypothetical protein
MDKKQANKQRFISSQKNNYLQRLFIAFWRAIF